MDWITIGLLQEAQSLIAAGPGGASAKLLRMVTPLGARVTREQRLAFTWPWAVGKGEPSGMQHVGQSCLAQAEKNGWNRFAQPRLHSSSLLSKSETWSR